MENSPVPIPKSRPPIGLIISIALIFLVLGMILGFTLSIFYSVIPAQAPTSDITTFVDSQKRFRLQLPVDWKVIYAESSDIPQFQARDGSTLSVLILDNNTDNLSSFLADLDNINKTSWEGKPSKKIISSGETTVSGLPAIKRVENWLAADYITINTYILVDKNVYSFFITPMENPYNQTEVYTKYQSVIDSFEPIFSTSELTCPSNGWQNCMPILSEEGKRACSTEAMAWYKANCPNFKGSAL